MLLTGHQSLAPCGIQPILSRTKNYRLHPSRGVGSSQRRRVYIALFIQRAHAYLDLGDLQCGKAKTSSLVGLWDPEGRCLAHTGGGVGQAQNGRNIFAKQTELQDVLRMVQKRER